MQNSPRLFLITMVMALAPHATAGVQAVQTPMTFFITSVGSGKEGIWVAWRVPTDTARRWRRRSAPVTGRGMLT